MESALLGSCTRNQEAARFSARAFMPVSRRSRGSGLKAAGTGVFFRVCAAAGKDSRPEWHLRIRKSLYGRLI